jgi:Tol biopolymer transport system component
LASIGVIVSALYRRKNRRYGNDCHTMEGFMRRVLLIFILCLLAGTSVRAQEPVPYLYYYSDLLRAFVVERADGTDSRVLGAGLMTDTALDISGPGWSPSGKWFAWTAPAPRDSGGRYRTWVVSADGTQRLTILDSFEGDVRALSWSPAEDKLLIVQHRRYGDYGVWTTITLLDADTQKVVMSLGRATLPTYDYLPVVWTPDGQRGFFYYDDYYDPYGTYLVLVSFTVSGEFNERVLHTQSVLDWSPPGRMIYLENGSRAVVMEDFVSGAHLRFRLQPNTQIDEASWSPDGKYALIYSRPHGTYDRDSLWLASLADHSLTLISPDAQIPNSCETCHYWQTWSPTADQMVFVSTDMRLHLVALASRAVTDLNTAAQVSQWLWSADLRVLFLLTDSGDIYRYDVLEGRSTSLGHSQFDFYWSGAAPSPDGHYLALAWNERAILDIQSGVRIHFMPHSLSVYAGVGTGGFRWHPSSDWIITGEGVAFSSGGGGPAGAGVFKLDGTVRREFGVCYFSENCADWLPDNVIPHLSPGSPESVLQQPVMTLKHDDWITGVAWSPDGTQLASHGFHGKLYIWDVNQDGARQVKVLLSLSCTDRPCRLSWSPDGRLVAVENAIMEYSGGNPRIGVEVWVVSSGQRLDLAEGNAIRWLDDGGYTILSNADADSPDGARTAHAQDLKGIDVLNTQSGQVLSSFPVERARALQWTPDSLSLAFSGGRDVTNIVLWNPTSNRASLMESSNNRYAIDFNLMDSFSQERPSIFILPSGNRRRDAYSSS